jgi:hypothetical protein
MCNTYYGCNNITGNTYFYSNNITNVCNCFYGRNNSTRLNIYVHANTTTNTTVMTASTSSLVGSEITWIDDTATNGCHYNTQYNIYVYPVASVKEAYCNDKYSNVSIVTDMDYALQTDNTVSVVSEYQYTPVEQPIDSGYAYTININNTERFNGVQIEGAEVK